VAGLHATHVNKPVLSDPFTPEPFVHKSRSGPGDTGYWSQPRDHRGVLTLPRAADTAATMSRLRILRVSLAFLFLTLGTAHAQYVYIKHPEVLVKQGATTAVLPANPLRAFVYCVIASPGKGEPLAPSVVRGLGLFGSGRPDFMH
jgi:hypothetical protein